MTTEEQTPTKHPNRNKYIGRALSVVSLVLSIALGLWQAWLIPIINTLGEQGRMNEGDPDGCLYGLLMVLTVFLAPVVGLLAMALALVGFRLNARILAIIALVAVLVALLPMIPMWLNFFGS